MSDRLSRRRASRGRRVRTRTRHWLRALQRDGWRELTGSEMAAAFQSYVFGVDLARGRDRTVVVALEK